MRTLPTMVTDRNTYLIFIRESRTICFATIIGHANTNIVQYYVEHWAILDLRTLVNITGHNHMHRTPA